MSVDYLSALKRLQGTQFDLILMDPPYQAGFYEPAIAAILEHDLLAMDGILVMEIKTGMASGGEKYLELTKKKAYGDVTLETYERRINE